MSKGLSIRLLYFLISCSPNAPSPMANSARGSRVKPQPRCLLCVWPWVNLLTFSSPATGAVSQALRRCMHKILPCPLSALYACIYLFTKLPLVQEDPQMYEGSLEFCIIPEGSGCVSGRTYATNNDSERPLEAECYNERTGKQDGETD